MLGMMMHRPLLISALIEHAARFHGDGEIVSREPDRSLMRYDYRTAESRAGRMALALDRLGLGEDDRLATLAFNNHRHFELYYAISGSGRVIHTVNPRLFPEQICYMLDHAEDRVLFFDPIFADLVAAIAPLLKTVKYLVMMAPAATPVGIDGCLNYETLIDAESGHYTWPQFDENRASSLCYTSGTAGEPKGTLYSHRSTLLHAMSVVAPDAFGLSASDSVCPVVPMFHVNAWGMPYACALVGCKLVLPGPSLDGESLCSLWRDEGVTASLGVPTIWQAVLRHAEVQGLGRLNRVVIGGSAAPPAMIDEFERKHGVTAIHAWGMTELSPLGTTARFKAKHEGADPALRSSVRASQGRPIFLVDVKITDAQGFALPHDGVAVGELLVRGPWVAAGYFRNEAASQAAIDEGGWFRTGDVCSIDADGYVRIVDRSKDLIKSGGEWISSIDLENAAMAHPAVAEAAVIGIAHPKWDERPLMLVVARAGCTLDLAELREFLAGRVSKWWLPDEIRPIDQIPHGATGKILKSKLREQFKDHILPTAQ